LTCLFKKLMRVECKVKFKFLGKFVGMAEYATHKIEIDLTGNDNIAKTFLHELIHLLHPKWEENRVLAEENKLWPRLTHKQVYRVYRKLYKDALRVK